jgi:hypothetical protein
LFQKNAFSEPLFCQFYQQDTLDDNLGAAEGKREASTTKEGVVAYVLKRNQALLAYVLERKQAFLAYVLEKIHAILAYVLEKYADTHDIESLTPVYRSLQTGYAEDVERYAKLHPRRLRWR